MPRPAGSKRSAANQNDGPVDANERILKEVYELYTKPGAGLCDFAESIGLELKAPRKKITAMLIGNHSAGKSSFINWYVGESVMRTGVAIETQGFTFVTSGKKRETYQGPATMQLNPHFHKGAKLDGFVDHLSTEISTSQEKKFPLVDLIDTPGLVDGHFSYPFDIKAIMHYLADNEADMILVFVDPIGQALVELTMSLVHELDKSHQKKMHYYLSKADTVPAEADRNKVLVQITQGLSQRISNSNFDLATIYVPQDFHEGRRVPVENRITDVCKDIEKTINHVVQRNLNQLETDCTKVRETVEEVLKNDAEVRAANNKARIRGGSYFLGSLLGPLLLALYAISLNAAHFAKAVPTVVTVASFVAPSDHYRWHFIIVLLLFTAILFLLGRRAWITKKTMSWGDQAKLKKNRDELVEKTLKRKNELYQELFKQAVREDH